MNWPSRHDHSCITFEEYFLMRMTIAPLQDFSCCKRANCALNTLININQGLGYNSAANWQTIMHTNSNFYLCQHTKIGWIKSICYQYIDQKFNSDINQETWLCYEFGKMTSNNPNLDLVNIKAYTVVSILIFMSMINFLLSWVQHDKSCITLG